MSGPAENRELFISGYNQKFYLESGARPIACLCGSMRSKKLFDKDRYGLKSPTVLCKNCGLVFTSPRPSSEFLTEFYCSDTYRYFYEVKATEDEIRVDYEVRYQEHNFIHETCQKYLQAIGEIRRPRILEIGAGGGWNLVPFVGSCEVQGIEFSPMLCKMGRQHGIAMMEGGLEKLDDLTSKFDLIIANHVIEHFFDFELDMRALVGMMEENGVMYLGVPDIYHYNPTQIQNAHNYYFSQATFEHYCRFVGLEALEAGKDNSGIHQYGVFHAAGASVAPASDELGGEYSIILRKHRTYTFKATAAAMLSYVGLRDAEARPTARRSSASSQ